MCVYISKLLIGHAVDQELLSDRYTGLNARRDVLTIIVDFSFTLLVRNSNKSEFLSFSLSFVFIFGRKWILVYMWVTISRIKKNHIAYTMYLYLSFIQRVLVQKHAKISLSLSPSLSLPPSLFLPLPPSLSLSPSPSLSLSLSLKSKTSYKEFSLTFTVNCRIIKTNTKAKYAMLDLKTLNVFVNICVISEMLTV